MVEGGGGGGGGGVDTKFWTRMYFFNKTQKYFYCMKTQKLLILPMVHMYKII